MLFEVLLSSLYSVLRKWLSKLNVLYKRWADSKCQILLEIVPFHFEKILPLSSFEVCFKKFEKFFHSDWKSLKL